MPFGLYVHFPFCRNKCSYCDFYKELYESGLEARFFDALMTETNLAAEAQVSTDNQISTIYIGGGTPTLMNIERFTQWLALVRELFQVPEGIEFSIENNPEAVTLEILETYKSLGVNRPTYGIQSFNQKLLKMLDRKHVVEDTHRVVYWTNALGYTNFGVDLIFGMPGQTSGMLSDDLDQLLDLAPPHISFYQLTIEPGTILAARVESGQLKMPESETLLAFYRGGCERMAEAGYERYEVSSFAKPGFECRHNLGYWEGNDFLALGPSGHSFMNGRRFANSPDLMFYLRELSEGRRPLVTDISGIEERMTEAIMLGLRTARGIDRHQFALRFGVPIEEKLDRKQYDLFVNSGHVVADSDTVRLSDDGICVADEITRRLLK
ncbi:MAG TPA: radical SAM family heme chaperone HemW [Candidatus Acidoferrum sp.]|nr:radical SAM family heme chaperone HemW [Candidatus Acidoferrum sp.]